MKKKQISDVELINWWLEKYHNTNLEKIMEEHPDWKEIDEKVKLINDYKGWSKEENDAILQQQNKNSREFFKTYAVTEEQHDEWCEWAKEEIRKRTKLSKEYINRKWGFVYLQTSPSVIETTIE